ncbi:hypothetical protein C7E18_23345, partial [Stenotrophomonas maltophilia]
TWLHRVLPGLYQARRSIISFLISRSPARVQPFGQVRAQFMMVWQRYSLTWLHRVLPGLYQARRSIISFLISRSPARVQPF